MIRTSTQEQARLADSYGRDIPEGTVCCFCGQPLASTAVFRPRPPPAAGSMARPALWPHPSRPAASINGPSSATTASGR